MQGVGAYLRKEEYRVRRQLAWPVGIERASEW